MTWPWKIAGNDKLWGMKFELDSRRRLKIDGCNLEAPSGHRRPREEGRAGPLPRHPSTSSSFLSWAPMSTRGFVSRTMHVLCGTSARARCHRGTQCFILIFPLFIQKCQLIKHQKHQLQWVNMIDIKPNVLFMTLHCCLVSSAINVLLINHELHHSFRVYPL